MWHVKGLPGVIITTTTFICGGEREYADKGMLQGAWARTYQLTSCLCLLRCHWLCCHWFEVHLWKGFVRVCTGVAHIIIVSDTCIVTPAAMACVDDSSVYPSGL